MDMVTRPVSPMRPDPKPPFSDIYPTTVAELTKMRLAPWRKWLEWGGSQSYARLFPDRVKEILEGIEHGVNVGYLGDRTRDRECRNLRSAEESDEVMRKVDAVIGKDVADKKKAGPFEQEAYG